MFDKMSLWWFFGFLVVNTAEKKYLAALFGESLHAIPQLLRLLLKACCRKPQSWFCIKFLLYNVTGSASQKLLETFELFHCRC
jgi:hypothetical protein